MEEIRDLDHRLVCRADSEKGLIEYANRKEVIRIRLPAGGETVFIRGERYTLVRRAGPGKWYVFSGYQYGY